MPAEFVHLHLHTEYSLLDGANRIPEVMQRAKDFGMPAVGMTDHGNLFGAIEFFQEAKKAGIKPIIGCEVYMAPGLHTDRGATNGRDAAYHLTLLATDHDGYQNLVKLVSIAHLDGMYYKPRIDKELLAQHSGGLLGLSGCLKGEIPAALQADQYNRARDLAAQYRDILGADRFFLEMHDHGIEAQLKVNRVLPRIAQELGLGLVAANDVHFLERKHHDAHDVMICIGTGSNVADERRMKYVPELYFKSPAEMRALFREHPEACDNTLAIAERCHLEIEFGNPKYPDFPPPEGLTQNAYLRQICEEGVRQRYGPLADSAEIRERLEREIGVLEKQGFVNYFLIVWDFIKWAKEHGIPVGPGRGSAAGSMVAFVMGITDIDPIKFKLLFERFLNPERVSPPDIDVDFCQNRRPEVIDYVRRKYGERAVAQIVTFGTLGAKSVVRDVGRVLGWSYGDADRIARMVPNELGITLAGDDKKNNETGEIQHIAGAIDKNPELKKAVEEEPAVKQLWEYATTLEGLTRGVGVHAAGVVISDRDLSEYIPLTRANDGSIVSQYEMGPLTDLGMLKMDFLGLKTLTVITDAETLIRKKVAGFDINQIPLNDQPTFDLLNRGETIAVFQLESGGMVHVCRQFDIKDIEDINAILALYRPGPMELIPDYIKRKKGIAKIKHLHPLLAQVTADTYGIFVYQEQVMAAASVLAGYSLGGADLLRRAMGKKDKAKMARERVKFVQGCKELNKIDEKKANDIFDLLEKFAGYGFNRSHSAAYAWISYQTAYLKANYPVEFMAAVMSNEVANTEKISVFVAECERLGITILPPDVNRSTLKFTPEEVNDQGIAQLQAVRRAAAVAQSAETETQAASAESAKPRPAENAAALRPRLGSIRFGLAAVKNVGDAAMQNACREREQNGPFKSLEDFCARIDTKKTSRKALESLVKCGAFDWTGEERAQLFAEIEGALAAAASVHRDRASGQVSLFDTFDTGSMPAPRSAAARVPPWSLAEKLAFEKELLGFYVTGHPLDEYRALLDCGKFVPIGRLGDEDDKTVVLIAGSLTTVEKKFTKREGKPFAVVTVEDLTGTVEVMVWAETFAKCAALLEPAAVVSICGRLDKREESPRIVASEMKALKRPDPVEKPIVLDFDCRKTTEADLVTVRDILGQSPGKRRVEFRFTGEDGRQLKLFPSDDFRVAWSPDVASKLKPWLKT
jgi:DNA polymerase-3 subunit alpha